MRKIKLLTTLLALVAIATAATAQVAINETNFPDANFRSWVSSNCDTDADGSLSTAELAAVTKMNVNSEDIASLKGIEYFTALTYLDCGSNQLTTLDVTQNTALTKLDCEGNELTSLDVSQNTALTNLRCYGNQLTTLDVTQNTALTSLDCDDNELTSLNVSKNTALTYLTCFGNQISGKAMTDLVNSLADRSSTTAGNFRVIRSTSSTEGNVITKSQVAIAKAKNWNVKTYSDGGDYEGSPDPEGIEINATNFPDANFRAYVAQKSIDQDEDGWLTDAELAAVTKMDLDGKDIASLKGIEYFTALTELRCRTNSLTTLDLSKNTELEILNCANNTALTTLDVSKNTALTKLNCSNTALTTLQCSSNELTALDLSKNTALTTLYCNYNQLTALDLSKNTALTLLECGYNQLTALDVTQNTALTELNCVSNQLTALDVSKNTALAYLYCTHNQLTTLDVSKNTALKSLHCYLNKISGTAMTDLVNGLVDRSSTTAGEFQVINLTSSLEGNAITKSQVAIAKAKNWNVLTSNNEDYEGIAEYPFWLGSTQVTEANKDDILGDGGKAKFDPKTNTLTWNNPTIMGVHESALIYTTLENLTIDAPAGLVLSSEEAKYLYAQNLTINGDLTSYLQLAIMGTLNVNGNVKIEKNDDIGTDIYAESGIVINGDVDVKSDEAFWTNGSLKITGNVKAESTAYSGAIIGSGSDIVIEGDVEIKSNHDAIHCNKSLKVIGNIKVEYTNNSSYPIWTHDDIIIEGDVDIKSASYSGLRSSEGTIEISGDVTMVITHEEGIGILASSGKIVVKSGRWDIQANEPLMAKEGIVMPETHKIWTPDGGKVAGKSYTDSNVIFYIITEADGTTPASNVIIDLRQEDLSIAFSQTEVEVAYGEAFEAPTLTFDPNEDAARKAVLTNGTWTSSDEAVATVDNDGKVTLAGAGTTTITISFPGDEDFTAAEASYTLTVSKATATLSFSETTAETTYGEDFTAPTLTTVPDGVEVSYASSDEAVATVDAETGAVTPLKAGEVTITATFAGNENYNEATASYTLTINKGTATLAFSESAVTANVGMPFTGPELTTTPEGLTVSYTSSDESVATVDAETGKLTAVGKGTTTITATFAGNDQYEAATASYTVTASTGVPINANVFPDEAFRNYLLSQTYGQDGFLTDEEIEALTTLEVTGLGIKTLEGMQLFTNLTYLDCSDNALTELDVTPFEQLEYLDCGYNELTTVDVSKNTELEVLSVTENPLEGLKNLPAGLQELYCVSCGLTELDVTGLKELRKLYCRDNELTELDVTQNKELVDLWADENHLLTLDLQQNGSLSVVRVEKQSATLPCERTGQTEYRITVPEGFDMALLKNFTVDGKAAEVELKDGQLVFESEVQPKMVTYDYDTQYLKEEMDVKVTITLLPTEPVSAELSFAVTAVEAVLGETFEAPELQNPNGVTVTWSSSDESVATVDAETGEVTLVGVGTTTITATFAGTDFYEAATVSYELTVKEPVITGIDGLHMTVAPADVYDLGGRKVKNVGESLVTLKTGVYIINGRKMVKR